MKKLCVVSFRFCRHPQHDGLRTVFIQGAGAERSSCPGSLKSIEGTVKVEGDKLTFVADNNQKSWSVEDPEALKGHEGHHVQVKAQVDADKGSIHITEIKMLKSSTTKKEEMKKLHGPVSQAGRRPRRPFSAADYDGPVAPRTPESYLKGGKFTPDEHPLHHTVK